MAGSLLTSATTRYAGLLRVELSKKGPEITGCWDGETRGKAAVMSVNLGAVTTLSPASPLQGLEQLAHEWVSFPFFVSCIYLDFPAPCASASAGLFFMLPLVPFAPISHLPFPVFTFYFNSL